ncbi:MAG: heme exporter protein CcmB [Acidimicrobiales bacterium]
MLSDALLIARKDLLIERRSKVLTTQLLPFGMIVLILFGFGLSPDRRVATGDGEGRAVLAQVSPGLFWLAVFFSALLAFSRAFAIEAGDGNLDALRLTGLDPAGIFLGKATAIAVELFVVELVLGAGSFLLYAPELSHPLLLAVTVVSTTLAVALAGTLYAALASGMRVRDTLVPLLSLPALSPVLLGASIATEAALFGPSSDGWAWAGLLGAFALLYLGAGILAFGRVLEEA